MFQEEKILLVINPISGSIEKESFIEEVKVTVENLGHQFLLYLTTGKDDCSAIRALVEVEKPHRVLAAGGDGTIAMVSESIGGPETVVGILPMGSANGLAKSLDIPPDPHAALEVALSHHYFLMDGVRINGELSLHLSDLGLNALLVKNYEEGEIRGKLGYAREVVKTLSEHESFQVTIRTDQEEITTEAVIVILANAQMYGTGVAINPFGDMSDGKFEIVIAKKVDIIELTKLIAGNTSFDPEVVQILTVTSAHITCDEPGVHFQIDGEYKGKVASVKSEILPGFMRVAVPNVESAST